MSILKHLKKISAGQSTQLYARHPLRADAHETRLRYLGAVALACAPERDPSERERRAFLALGESLGLDGDEAVEQLDERASVQEDDIRRLLGLIRERNLRCLYLLDVAWMHLVDGAPDTSEREVAAEVAGLLEVDRSRLPALQSLLTALRDRQPRTLAQLLPSWSRDPELGPHLAQIATRCFPLAGVLQDRWIDHGDGSLTDIRSALRWRGGPEFGGSSHADRPGVVQVHYQANPDQCAGDAVLASLAVRYCQDVKAGEVLLTLATPGGALPVRALRDGRVMAFAREIGDVVRPGEHLLTLSCDGGPQALLMSLPEDGKPQDSHLEQVLAALRRANIAQPPPGMSPWRLPSRDELLAVRTENAAAGIGIGLGFAFALRDRHELSEVFQALKGHKLWCHAYPAARKALTRDLLAVFNLGQDGGVMLLLCRNPIEPASTGTAP